MIIEAVSVLVESLKAFRDEVIMLIQAVKVLIKVVRVL